MSRLLLAFLWAMGALAMGTMLPWPGPRPNDLGYFSFCPFAPWSTLALLLLAGIAWVIRQYFLTRPPTPPPIA